MTVRLGITSHGVRLGAGADLKQVTVQCPLPARKRTLSRRAQKVR